MKTIPIEKVSVLPDGRLGVFPKIKDSLYQYIYRAAAGVSWNENEGCFQSTEPKEWNYQKWYRQILSVANSPDLGRRLVLNEKTEFDGPEEDFKEKILEADKKVQKWMDEHQT